MGTPTIGTGEVSSWASQREAKPPLHLLSECTSENLSQTALRDATSGRSRTGTDFSMAPQDECLARWFAGARLAARAHCVFSVAFGGRYLVRDTRSSISRLISSGSARGHFACTRATISERGTLSCGAGARSECRCFGRKLHCRARGWHRADVPGSTLVAAIAKVPLGAQILPWSRARSLLKERSDDSSAG